MNGPCSRYNAHKIKVKVVAWVYKSCVVGMLVPMNSNVVELIDG